MMKQPEYNLLTGWCLDKQREQSHIQNIYSETDFSTNSNYDEFANELPFVGDILQSFQFEPLFAAAKIQAKKNLSGTSTVFDWLLSYRTWCAAISHVWSKLNSCCAY